MGGEVPDSAPIFEEPPSRDFGSFCVHASYRVVTQQRQIVCNACKGNLDPFDLILRQAHRQAVREDTESEIEKKRAQLQILCGEEKRVKARTRNAKKKDADSAVTKALAKYAEDRARTVWSLIEARSAIRAALTRLGHKDRI
jgi:hypothetical protein